MTRRRRPTVIRQSDSVPSTFATKNSPCAVEELRPSGSAFRPLFISLWFRLMALAIVALMFCEALKLAQGKAQGWSFYLTSLEVTFEVLVRLIFAGLAGIVLGSLCTLLLVPVLLYFRSARDRVADWTTKVAVVLMLFLVGDYAVRILFKWSYSWSDHRRIIDDILSACFYLAFALALLVPRMRKNVVASLDGMLDDKITRRTAIATLAGTAAMVTTEFVLSKTRPSIVTSLDRPRPKSNFLLITFDALSAEDMSLYGYKLATTPNIDAFARKSTVFTNFYSGSTFTTPSVATMLMGFYPSESLVYQTEGRVRAKNGRSLPHLMRAAGYSTGAFLSNSNAYYLAQDLENAYDFLPEPSYQEGGLRYLWDVARPLHQNSGIGSRLTEYWDLEYVWNTLNRLPINLPLRLRPVVTFEHARQILAKLPQGFFLWVHVMTPHSPYIPDSADQGRFVQEGHLQTLKSEPSDRWLPHYSPDQQPQIDRLRLFYDEFIATADRAFGEFMLELENGGRLLDTTVIVSADHGESFEGGVYQHESAYQTRPVIHIPLIVRAPGQEDGRKVAFTADQTALAPTILELAGLPEADSMRGGSLAHWLNRDGQGGGLGQAFCQFLERNSVFKPLRHGTVGLIDGKSQHQYVLHLDTQKGWLRPLNEAQIWNLDRSAENPALAEQLRAAIYLKFPELRQETERAAIF